MRGIVEITKGFMKFIIIMAIAYGVVSVESSSFNGFLQVGFIESFSHGKYILIKLAGYILLGLIIVAIGDLGWEKWSYHKKLKQSKQEQKQELKEREGSPEIRQRIRTIQREMSQKRMIQEIPTADVIVTNPTHISVALKYDMNNMISPEVVAMGADHLALQIRKIAREHDVPIVENVPVARAL